MNKKLNNLDEIKSVTVEVCDKRNCDEIEVNYHKNGFPLKQPFENLEKLEEALCHYHNTGDLPIGGESIPEYPSNYTVISYDINVNMPGPTGPNDTTNMKCMMYSAVDGDYLNLEDMLRSSPVPIINPETDYCNITIKQWTDCPVEVFSLYGGDKLVSIESVDIDLSKIESLNSAFADSSIDI